MITSGQEVMRDDRRASEVGIPYDNNNGLFDGVWADIIDRKIVMITNCAGELGLRHGMAVLQIKDFLAESEVEVVPLKETDRFEPKLARAVILLGDVEELQNPVVQTLLKEADYHPSFYPANRIAGAPFPTRPRIATMLILASFAGLRWETIESFLS